MGAFLAIVFAVVMLIGPIMMMKPTKTQKKQAKLRTLASQSGLMVGGGMTLSSGRFVPQYTKPFKEREAKPSCFELRKQSFSHEGHFSGEWDWASGEPENLRLPQLKQMSETVDDDYFAFGVSNVGVFVMWNEALRGSTEEQAIEKIVDFLNNLLTVVDMHPIAE